MQGRLKARSSGTTVMGIKNKDLRKIEIPIPKHRQTQDRVSEVLSKYDDLIENNKRRIELLEESARQLYKEWFVRFRFPGHEHVNIVDGVPEGWEKKKLKDLFTLNYGKALKADNRIPGDFPVYGSSGVVGTHNKALVKGPGIIVGRKGNVGAVHWSHLDFFPIDTVYFINTEESSYFIYYALLHTAFINTDVAVPGLNRDFAYSREVIVPTNTLREEFEDEVAPIFKQCHTLEKYNDQLAKARDLLLPKLMNGEIAV
jgi:type I restriction enzyme S subunit